MMFEYNFTEEGDPTPKRARCRQVLCDMGEEETKDRERRKLFSTLLSYWAKRDNAL